MEFQQFNDKVSDGVRKFLGAEVETELRDIHKNNGVLMKGITIIDGRSNLSPTIYLDSFYEEYQNGKSIGEVVHDITEIYADMKVDSSIDMKFFADYAKIKKRIFCKLINYEKNQEMLQNVPHRKYLDLAIVCYYAYMNDLVGNGTITIQKHHLELWQIEEERLIDEALENTEKNFRCECYDIQDMMKEMIRESMQEDVIAFPVSEENTSENGWTEQMTEQLLAGILQNRKKKPMYVVTNSHKFLGAVCMLFDSVLSEMAEKIGSDFIILPSSVHEVIMVPECSTHEVEKLKALVREVNDTQLEPQEVLSEAVYYYNRKQKRTFLL